jgi:hypothetical protein
MESGNRLKELIYVNNNNDNNNNNNNNNSLGFISLPVWEKNCLQGKVSPMQIKS